MNLPYKICVCPQCITIVTEGQKRGILRCPKCRSKPMAVYVRDDYIRIRVRKMNGRYKNPTKNKKRKVK